MIAKLSGKILVNTEIDLIDSVDIGNVYYPINFNPVAKFESGIGDDQANEAFTDTRTLSASGSEDLDLSGSLMNAFGRVVVFKKIKSLIIIADSENINDVLVGGASSNTLDTFFGDSSDVVKVKPGGTFALISTKSEAYDVFEGDADKLKVANSAGGTSVTYTIIVVGTVRENNIFNGSLATIEVSGTVNTII